MSDMSSSSILCRAQRAWAWATVSRNGGQEKLSFSRDNTYAGPGTSRKGSPADGSRSKGVRKEEEGRKSTFNSTRAAALWIVRGCVPGSRLKGWTAEWSEREKNAGGELRGAPSDLVCFFTHSDGNGNRQESQLLATEMKLPPQNKRAYRLRSWLGINGLQMQLPPN